MGKPIVEKLFKIDQKRRFVTVGVNAGLYKIFNSPGISDDDKLDLAAKAVIASLYTNRSPNVGQLQAKFKRLWKKMERNHHNWKRYIMNGIKFKTEKVIKL